MSPKTLTCTAAAAVLLAWLVAPAPARPEETRAAIGQRAPAQPWQTHRTLSLPDGTTSVCVSVASVPADRRLAIEYVSALVRPPAGQHLRSSQVRTKVGPELVFHGLLGQATGVFNEYASAQLVRLYADAGTDVAYCADRDAGAGSMAVNVGLSGHWFPAVQP